MSANLVLRTLVLTSLFAPIAPASAADLGPSLDAPTTASAVPANREDAEAANTESRETEQWRTLALGASANNATPRIEDLPKYLENYREANVYDPVLAVYTVKAQPALTPAHATSTTPALDARTSATAPAIALSGEVSLGWYKVGTERMLSRLGFHITTNSIRVLPDVQELGSNIFARASTGAATMRRHPDMAAEQVNAIPLGWPLRLLRASTPEDTAEAARQREQTRGRRDRSGATALPYAGRWYLAQSSEGYIGFVREDQIVRTHTYRLPDAILSRPTTYTAGAQPAELPAGTALYTAANSNRSNGANYLVTIGGQEHPFAPAPGSFRHTQSHEITSATILQLAEPLLKTGYEWGGVTNAGIDCSGFTQYIYKMLGVYLPRDARPQSVVGQIVAFGTDVERDAQAGDLVYFADPAGRISHIGMALGGGMLIHSSGGPGVHVCDYHEKSRSRPNGLLERVLFARRVIR